MTEKAVIRIIVPFKKQKATRRSDLQSAIDENCYQFDNQFHQQV